MKTSELTFTIQIFQEGRQYVAYNPELDVSSCGKEPEEARRNLFDAVRGFLKSAKKMGTLVSILEVAGFIQKKKYWATPSLVALDRFSLAFS
jgi:predicted RNase H-like HicB family nuclease